MSPLLVLLLVSSAFFAWSMGSHYSGAVMGTAYGSGIASLRQAQLLTALLALAGSLIASVGVIDTYANRLISGASLVDVTAALLSAAVVTTVSTYLKLPTSTIQIYTFSLLGVALVRGLPTHLSGFGLLILFWALGPLCAFVLGNLLGRVLPGFAARGQRVLMWFVVAASLYSAFTLGSNDVSNAVSSLVMLNLMPARVAGLWGGFFMAIGALTWGQRLLQRIGRDILHLNVPLAATAQLSQAITLSIINVLGYNASINQTIVGGLAGAGTAVRDSRLDRKVLRNIVLGWIISPVLGVTGASLVSLLLHALFGP